MGLDSIIIGFGRAGKDLHYCCLQKAIERQGGANFVSGKIAVVDISPVVLADIEDLPKYHYIRDVEDFDPERTVVHICTEPVYHLKAVKEAIAAGFKKFIIEKPLVQSLAEFECLTALQAEYNLKIIGVANWLSSPLVLRMRELIGSGELGRLSMMTLENSKPRVSRTLRNKSHSTCFDVEMPHQVALALFLAGENAELLDAHCSDLQFSSDVVRYMGSASMTLIHDQRVPCRLISSLASPTRKRYAQLEFTEGTVGAYFPTGNDDSCSWLEIGDHHKSPRKVEVFEDDALSTCFMEYYKFFCGQAPSPHSGLSFNKRLVDLLHNAKRICGIPCDSVEPSSGANLHFFDTRRLNSQPDHGVLPTYTRIAGNF